MLQLEGELTVSAVAERLEVARSTAHRLLRHWYTAISLSRTRAAATVRGRSRTGGSLQIAHLATREPCLCRTSSTWSL
ncbi:helix-turn-helix domain-containing protein [Aeromicrobium sp. UC242_57]|uniref:helix-turn-helix domain-containing protein n=1 Tax=Aeromicrobium sp. UC242_57 TaxID=3374624 RepID=UPI00379CE8CE